LLCTFNFLVDFGFGASDNLVSFDFGGALGFFDDLLRTLFGLSDEIRRFLFGFPQHFSRTLGSKILLMLATFSCCQAISDLCLTVCHRFL